jgi:hypothetical protein
VTTWFDEESTAQVLRSLVGRRLEAVYYLEPTGIALTSAAAAGLVHAVDHGVQLRTPAGLTTLMWQLDGDCAALSAVADAGEEDGLTELIEAVDVTGTPAWRPMIGQIVTGVTQTGHRSVEGCPTTTWACRLDLGDHGSVVVALGEIRDGRLDYAGNNVAILFGSQAFDLFRHYDGDPWAWSVPL